MTVSDFYASVHFKGDPSVGIFSRSFNVEIPDFREQSDMSNAKDQMDARVCREEVRGLIHQLYRELEGELNGLVSFSDELDSEYDVCADEENAGFPFVDISELI